MCTNIHLTWGYQSMLGHDKEERFLSAWLVMSCWFIYISIAKKEKGKFLVSPYTHYHYTLHITPFMSGYSLHQISNSIKINLNILTENKEAEKEVELEGGLDIEYIARVKSEVESVLTQTLLLQIIMLNT